MGKLLPLFLLVRVYESPSREFGNCPRYQFSCKNAFVFATLSQFFSSFCIVICECVMADNETNERGKKCRRIGTLLRYRESPLLNASEL